MQAQLVQCLVATGDAVQAGDVLLVIEAMKMEHELRAQTSGTVIQLFFQVGEVVNTHDLLLILEQNKHKTSELDAHFSSNRSTIDGHDRSDLQAVFNRLAFTQDAQRPDAIAKRHALGLRVRILQTYVMPIVF
jgi:pyruvate/2-oxoglutarate dehydrogenase complex dihydrolipoamide acyltransferase (E2) component